MGEDYKTIKVEPPAYSVFKETWLPILVSVSMFLSVGLFLFANSNDWLNLAGKDVVVYEPSPRYSIITDRKNCWVINEGDYRKSSGQWTAIYHADDLGLCIQKLRDLYDNKPE